MTVENPKIFIIDDDHSVRKSLLRLLRSLGFHAEAYISAEEFLEGERHEGTGCIILDIRMPGLSGMALQDELNRTDYTMPIIFITGHGDIPMSVQAMKKGAVDFLPKPFDDHELLDAVNRAVEKSKQVKVARAELDNVRKLLDRLSPREREILPFIIAGHLNKQIAFKLHIAEKTIKVHRGHIMKKLGVDSVADMVRLAEKAGIDPAGKPGDQ
jgi:FixJ family two-component response regulator